MRETFLQELDYPWDYSQLITMNDVYNRLINDYSKTDIDEIFEAHGFFGDKDWTVSSCEIIPPEGDKFRVTGEIIGEGGREGRNNFPLVDGANLLVNLQSEYGTPAYTGSLIVNLKYENPYSIYDRSIKTTVENGGLFYIEPPPARIPMTFEIKGDHPESPVYEISNEEFWGRVAGSGKEYVEEITMVVNSPPPMIFIPIIFK